MSGQRLRSYRRPALRHCGPSQRASMPAGFNRARHRSLVSDTGVAHFGAVLDTNVAIGGGSLAPRLVIVPRTERRDTVKTQADGIGGGPTAMICPGDAAPFDDQRLTHPPV